MMMTGKYTVADIVLQTTIAHGTILDFAINTNQGTHGKLTVTFEVDEKMTASDIEKNNGSDISVSVKGGKSIFVGICEEVALTNQASYKTVRVTAYTASLKMDKEPKKATYQSPSKTLQQLAQNIGNSYGIDIKVDNDCVIAEPLYQQNETDFQFLKRVAATKGKTLFVDASAVVPQIHIGKPEFRSFDAGVLGDSLGLSRNVGEMSRTAANGQAAEGYMFDTFECYSNTLEAGAGDSIDGVKVIKSSTIKLERGVIDNRITYAYAEGIKPTQEEVQAPALNKGVVTGKVCAINGNQIQVQLDTDGGAGEMIWVTYESAISNSFYCMPDEGDSVFLYFENSGNVVCLGSKHTSTDSPDFNNPRENVLTNHNKMVKLGEKKVTLSATRDLTEAQDPSEISIIMDEATGITVQSGRDIVIEAGENLSLFTGNVVNSMEKYAEGKAILEARHAQNEEIYRAESGTPTTDEYLANVLKSTLKTQTKNLVDMGKGMFMYDMWVDLFNGKDEEEEKDAPDPVERVETGVATLYGYERVVLQVDQNVITLDTEINVNSSNFKWLGYEQKTHEPQEKPLQDWWETILDGVQFALDIAGCIPLFGSVPDLINAGISLLRGNFAEAAMSAVAAIPFAGDAVGAVKIAGKGAKLVTKALSKTERVMTILQGLYVSAQAAYAIYQMKDGLADMWERMQKGENILANPEDVSMLFNLAGSGFMALRGMKSVGEGVVGKKLDIEYVGDSSKLNGNKTHETKGCGDPINVVTGSFELAYTDLQLRDVRETFFLKRIYESVYENKGMLLGNRWFLNIESRLKRDGESICVQLPDMKIIDFQQTEYGWENTRTNDRIWQLYSMSEGYRLKNWQEKITYWYDLEGRLISIADRFDNRTNLYYEGKCLSRMETASGQTLSFSYENGKLKTITTGDDRSLSYEYEQDLLIRVTLANESCISYEYDQNGNIHSITDQNENTYVTNEYDRRGRVVRQTTATGGEYILFYDERNRRTTFTDTVTGEQTVYEYDRNQNVVKTIYQDGTWEEYGYDDWENINYVRDRNGNEVYKAYDIYGNLLEEKLPSGLITTNEYDVHNRRVHQYDNAGREVTWTYDERGCLIGEAFLTAPGKWSSLSFSYDQSGRIIREENPNGSIIEFAYENFSEPVRRIYPEGETTWFEYDMAGRCLRERNEKGDIEYSYNRTDCVTQIKNREGSILRYRYDFLGNRIGILKPEQYENGNDYIRISYDKLDNMSEVITALGNVYCYKSGADGRILKAIHPNAYNAKTDDGEGMTFDYDETGRRIRVHYPDGGCERYFLDGNGNIIKKVAPEQYDEQCDDGAGYVYEYDKADRLIKVTDPSGTIQQVYIYDLADNIIKSIDARGYLTADNDEERIGILYTYNKAGWMLSKREPLYQEHDGQVFYKLTCFAYDDMGNLLEEKRYLDEQTVDSSYGRTHSIRYTYDKSNRLVQVSDDTGAAIKYAYDQTGYLVCEKVRVGEEAWKETRYEYSPSGRLTRRMVRLKEETKILLLGRKRESSWAVTELGYDRNGNLTKVCMPEGGCYYYEYDRDDRLVKERHVENGGDIANEICYTYDAAGNQTAVTDVNGNTYRYEYDLCDRETAAIAPDGGRTRVVYDKNGNVISRYMPLQKETGWKYRYDSSNRMTEVITPEGKLLNRFTYEADGQLASTMDELGGDIRLTYDLAGRRTYAVTTGGSSQSYRYDAMGNIIGLTDGMSNTTSFVLDSWGRITGVRKPDGTMEKYAYDHMGNILRAEDGEGHAVLYGYDLNGNMISRIDQLGARESFGYDRENRLVSMTDRNGTQTHISYNMYNSITGRRAVTTDQSSTVTESYGYYPDGSLRYAIGGGMRYDYSYDVMGRLVRKSASGRSLLINEYDLNGNRTAMTDLTGKRTEYRYNSLDQLEEVVDNGKVQVRYTYNADGTIRRMEVGTGLVTEYTYDADKNVISQKTVLSGIESMPGTGGAGAWESLPTLHAMNHRDRSTHLTLADNTYTYDANGNRTGKQTQAGLTAYHYDATQRLVKVDYPTASEEYRYDKAGNRMEKWINGAMTEQYAYDAANRMVSKDNLSLRADGIIMVECEEFAYDPQGNMLSDGKRSFTYDAANRLSHVTTKEGNTQVNRYDGEGLRAEMEENGRLVQFLFDGDKVVAETDCDQNVIRYIRGYELISSDSEKARTYYHYASDELGSITHVTDEAGNVCNHYEYDAFGDFTVREETVANRFGYTGEQYDPVAGLYYLRARFYNPVIGRFIQEDTYYGDGLNLYAYCGNNPVRYVDPSGFEACLPKQNAINELKKAGIENPEAVYDALRKGNIDPNDIIKKIPNSMELMNKLESMGLSKNSAAEFAVLGLNKKNFERLLKYGLDTDQAFDFMKRAKSVTDSKLKGILGEEVMNAIMEKNGYECLPTKLKSNNGIDGIYVKKGPDGKITEVVIGEAKFGSSRLNLDPEIGPQMSNKWIEGNLNRMIAEGAEEVKDAGKQIKFYLSNNGKYTATIFRIRNTGYLSVKYRSMFSNVYNFWK